MFGIDLSINNIYNLFECFLGMTLIKLEKPAVYYMTKYSNLLENHAQDETGKKSEGRS